MYLILAPTPQVRKWPFYGRALAVLNEQLQHSLDKKNIEHFRHELEQHLADARRIVAMLEIDLKAVNEAFPPKPKDGTPTES